MNTPPQNRELEWSKRTEREMWRTADSLLAAVVNAYSTAQGKRYRASAVLFLAVKERSTPHGELKSLSEGALGIVKRTEHLNVRAVPVSQDGFHSLEWERACVANWHDNAGERLTPL